MGYRQQYVDILARARRACRFAVAIARKMRLISGMSARRHATKPGLRYPILVVPLSDEDGGGYLAEVPDLPGCVGDGDTPAAAIADAERAIAEWIAEAKRLKRPVPMPVSPGQHSGRWVQRVPRSLHGRLAAVAKREGVSLNALVTAILAEGLGQRSGRSGPIEESD